MQEVRGVAHLELGPFKSAWLTFGEFCGQPKISVRHICCPQRKLRPLAFPRRKDPNKDAWKHALAAKAQISRALFNCEYSRCRWSRQGLALTKTSTPSQISKTRGPAVEVVEKSRIAMIEIEVIVTVRNNSNSCWNSNSSSHNNSNRTRILHSNNSNRTCNRNRNSNSHGNSNSISIAIAILIVVVY